MTLTLVKLSLKKVAFGQTLLAFGKLTFGQILLALGQAFTQKGWW